ncbi:MAG: OmpA family protein [Flavobacteriales bacterium]|nr:OmpA family protein [Flavobacteriales bacterium]
MRITLLLLSTIIVQGTFFGQIKFPSLEKEDVYNFVPDASFEYTNDEPCGWNQGLGKFDNWMQFWTSPTQTTPDLFSTRVSNTCWSHPAKHSSNRQRPKDGDNMVGIKCFGTGGTETYWHEYVQVQLKEPLKEDTLYYLEFYANASNRASRICNNIGALVHKEQISTRDRKPLYITPTINSEKKVKQSLLGWKKISGVFRASGGEEFVSIGNFYRDDETDSERLETGKDGAYYYLDEVTLRRARPGEYESPRPTKSKPEAPLIVLEERATTEEVAIEEVSYEVGTTIELKNIHFEFDRAELHPDSQEELDDLANMLFDNPYIHIKLSGHTDNVGNEEYNQKLSEARAQAVVAYLLHKDVEKDRLEFKGYGSLMPIRSNETEEGRTANRRVEFEVISN